MLGGNRPWEDADALILPDLKDCPWAMAKSRLILAAREFCSRAAVWRVQLEPFDSIADTEEYPDLIESSQVELVRVLSAYYGMDLLTPRVPTDFFALRVENGLSGVPQDMTIEGESVMLHPVPMESGVPIRVEATFKPSINATGFPSHLWDQYIEHIAEGAKARLYASQAKPYSDLQLAAVARENFNRGIGAAQVRSSKAKTAAVQRVRGRYF